MTTAVREKPIIFSAPTVRALLNTRPDAWPAEPIDPSKPFKWQTRRVVKPQPVGGDKIIAKGMEPGWIVGRLRDSENAWRELPCPYPVGTRLWVRETWRVVSWPGTDSSGFTIQFRAGGTREVQPDDEVWSDRVWLQCVEDCKAAGVLPDADGQYAFPDGDPPTRWRPAIHMPRWASRLTLEVVRVRVERVQDISEDDARAEGPPAQPIDCVPGERHRADFAYLWDRTNSPRGYPWARNPWCWVYDFKRVGESA